MVDEKEKKRNGENGGIDRCSRVSGTCTARSLVENEQRFETIRFAVEIQSRSEVRTPSERTSSDKNSCSCEAE